jgi:DNA replication protein DnaC
MRQLTLDKLAELHLGGMMKALKAHADEPKICQMEFEDRLLMLLDAEELFRKQRSLEWRLKRAGLRQNVRAEELDYRAGRTFDRTLFERLLSGEWLRQKRNVIITGPTGIGKTFLASALAHQACQSQLGARYFRTPRLLGELGIARGQGTMRTKLASLARVDLIVLDDWLLAPLSDLERRDLLEIVDDRYEKRSTLICAQLPLENWHDAIGDPTLADAILDRLIHNAYRLRLDGGSMRKARGLAEQDSGNIDPTQNPGEPTARPRARAERIPSE